MCCTLTMTTPLTTRHRPRVRAFAQLVLSRVEKDTQEWCTHTRIDTPYWGEKDYRKCVRLEADQRAKNSKAAAERTMAFSMSIGAVLTRDMLSLIAVARSITAEDVMVQCSPLVLAALSCSQPSACAHRTFWHQGAWSHCQQWCGHGKQNTVYQWCVLAHRLHCVLTLPLCRVQKSLDRYLTITPDDDGARVVTFKHGQMVDAVCHRYMSVSDGIDGEPKLLHGLTHRHKLLRCRRNLINCCGSSTSWLTTMRR